MSEADRLSDRLAVQDMVIAYATALDARDWAGFEALFEDKVVIDYRSLGTTYGVFTASEWAGRCRVLGAFQATHHKVTNFIVAFDGEGHATVRSYVDASHFIEAASGVLEARVLGRYEHGLIHKAAGWRISSCALTVMGYPGGRAAFDTAFSAARATFTA